MMERVFGAEHPDTLGGCARLAYWTGWTGDWAGGRESRLHGSPGLCCRPISATAALAWHGDLPRPLQQILFDTAADATPPAPPARFERLARRRWAMRWKPALNAFAITFGDRFPAAGTY